MIGILFKLEISAVFVCLCAVGLTSSTNDLAGS